MLVTFFASSRLQMGYIFVDSLFCLDVYVSLIFLFFLHLSNGLFFYAQSCQVDCMSGMLANRQSSTRRHFFSLFPHLDFEIRVKNVRSLRKWARGKKEGICWCISCSVRSVKARLDSFATNSVTSLCLAMLWGSEKKKKASFLCNFNSCLLVSVLSVFVRKRLHITEKKSRQLVQLKKKRLHV